MSQTAPPSQDHPPKPTAQDSLKTYYTAIVAFSTPSGKLHIGHALGQVIAHTTALYESAKNGQEVFFPFGIHATGKDILKIVDDVSRDPEAAERIGLDQSITNRIRSAASPRESIDALLEHFRTNYQASLGKIGIVPDANATFSTHEHDYFAFTQWTLRRLQKQGLIVDTKQYRPYCVDCDEVKSITPDQSEAIAVGKVNFNAVFVDQDQIHGGNFYCRQHRETPLTVAMREEKSIDYTNKDARQRTLNLIGKSTKFFPQKYAQDVPGIIASRREKPFERNAKTSIGTPSPFNPGAVVDALSDSNIYMEYYAVAMALRKGLLPAGNLTDQLFDYIFCDEGTAQAAAESVGTTTENIEGTKRLVQERYPIDLNVAGSEHAEVHFPFSLFTHANVLPEKLFPHEYLLTAHITRDGEKMSKSKGNVLQLDDLVARVEKRAAQEQVPAPQLLDSIRFFLIYFQSMDKDFDWQDAKFESVALRRVLKFQDTVKNLAPNGAHKTDEHAHLPATFDDSVYHAFARHQMEHNLAAYTRAMDQRNYRQATIIAFDTMQSDLKEYLRRVRTPDQEVIDASLKTQLRMLAPVMPRLTKSLYESHYGDMPKKPVQKNEIGLLDLSNDLVDLVRFEMHGREYGLESVKSMKHAAGRIRGMTNKDPQAYVRVIVPSLTMKEAFEASYGTSLHSQEALEPSQETPSVTSKQMQIRHYLSQRGLGFKKEMDSAFKGMSYRIDVDPMAHGISLQYRDTVLATR